MSIKDVRSQGVRGCPVRTFFGQGVYLRYDVRTFWCKKTSDFSKIYGVYERKREKVNFSRFCADVLTAPFHKIFSLKMLMFISNYILPFILRKSKNTTRKSKRKKRKAKLNQFRRKTTTKQR